MYKVTFSGIDGVGKSTSIDAISNTLVESGMVLIHPYRPAFTQSSTGRVYFAQRINGVTDWCHNWADTHRKRTLVGLINSIYSRVATCMESCAISKYSPDIILTGRDPVLDPVVYSSFYFPSSRHLSIAQKVRMVRAVNQARMADLLLYMDIDPEIAHNRILKRIENEKREGAKDREKWTHMHENPRDLGLLREKFDQTLSFLEDNLPIKIARVNAAQPHQKVIDEMLTIIQESLPSGSSPSSLNASFVHSH